MKGTVRAEWVTPGARSVPPGVRGGQAEASPPFRTRRRVAGAGQFSPGPPGTVSSQTWQGERPSWAAVCPPGKAPARSKRKRPAKQPPGRLKGLSQKPSPGAERPGCSALTPGPGADVLLLRGGGAPSGAPRALPSAPAASWGNAHAFSSRTSPWGAGRPVRFAPRLGCRPQVCCVGLGASASASESLRD